MGYQPRIPKPVTVLSHHRAWSYWRDWFSSTPCLLSLLAAGVMVSAGSAYGLWTFGWLGLATFGLVGAAQCIVKQHYSLLPRKQVEHDGCNITYEEEDGEWVEVSRTHEYDFGPPTSGSGVRRPRAAGLPVRQNDGPPPTSGSGGRPAGGSSANTIVDILHELLEKAPNPPPYKDPLDEPVRKGQVMHNLSSGGAIMFDGEDWVEVEKPTPPPTRLLKG